MNVSGIRNLDLMLRYDSTDTKAEGNLGYGWYHLFESSIIKEGNQLYFCDKPGDKIPFVSVEEMENRVCGEYDEDTKMITVHGKMLSEEDYVSVSASLKGCRIHRDRNGYRLTMKDGAEKGFDTQGRLIYDKNSTGQMIFLEYSKDSMKITDGAAGKTLDCAMKDGLILEVKDPEGNRASFQYDEKNNLISITSKRGTKNTYTYDEEHHILSGTDTNGRVFVSNTYDEKGRVLTQDDGDKDTPKVGSTPVVTNQNMVPGTLKII